MIASHFARPVERVLTRPATLRAAPSDEAEAVADLSAGAQFLLLDDSVGWAWGYAGEDRRVGYVRPEALASA